MEDIVPLLWHTSLFGGPACREMPKERAIQRERA
jgi:hypothetical protein